MYLLIKEPIRGVPLYMYISGGPECLLFSVSFAINKTPSSIVVSLIVACVGRYNVDLSCMYR